MNPQIVETLNVTQAATWLPWAVQYVFLMGLSYGAFVLSLPGLVWRRPGWGGISRLALLAAVLCGVCAPIALTADLHQPARAWHFYAHFTTSSWMSWGAFFIPLYLGGLVLYSALALRPDLARHADAAGRLRPLARMLAGAGTAPRGAVTAAAALAFVGALLVAVYTGAEVAVVSARALWHTPLLPLVFFVTALAGAVGLVLLFNRFSIRDGETVRRLSRLLVLTELALLALGGVWWLQAVAVPGSAAATALAEAASSRLWQGYAAWALATTLLILALAWRRRGSGLVLGVLALHSAWMARWSLFMGGQSIPKTGAGDSLYTLPMGPDGLLGIVGTAGLWVFLFVVATTLLPLQGLAAGEEPSVRT